MKFLIFSTTLLGLLLSLSNLHEIDAVPSPSSCLACQKFSNFLWNLTKNADDKLFNSLTKLCSEYSDLPGRQTENICNKTIRHVFGLIKERWNKDEICYDVKACGRRFAINLENINESNNLNDDADCQFCVYLNQKIKELLTGGPTEMEFKTHLEDMCHYLGSFEDECKNFIDEYLDEMFDFIKNDFVPRNLCCSMRICPKTSIKKSSLDDIPIRPTASEVVNLLPVNFTLSNSNGNSIAETPTCTICKQLVGIIKKELQDNSTQEEIINALDLACKLAPKKDQPKCKNIIEQYAKELIEILADDVDSYTACLMVGLCKSQLQNFIDHQLKGNTLCLECELITHFIQNKIYDYNNEEQIEEFIKNHVCKMMKRFVPENDCDTFIDNYGAIIMQSIAQNLFSTDFICYKELKLCKKTKIHIMKPKKDIDRCDICQDIIKNMSNIKQNEIEIEYLIEQGCSHLKSDSLRRDCALMVEAFSPYFLDMMDRFDNPKKICEAIDICLTPGKVHLLGGHKCTYGPTYWCHSVNHANACKAFEYCHERVWRKPNQV